MTEEKKEQPKLCPLLIIAGTETLAKFASSGYCLKESCALWVYGHKQSENPFYVLTYEGCGLIQEIFWERKKREDLKQREVTKSE